MIIIRSERGIMVIYKRGGWVARVCLYAFLLSTAVPCAADQDAEGNEMVRLRGFGTLGLARATNGQAEVARDLLQPRGISDRWSGRTDSNFGIQANVEASRTLEGVVQAVSRYHGRGNFAPELTEALLKYDPDAYLSLRAGRVGTDFFMHGDSRMVGYSQLTVRPSIDYFSSLAVTYLDGVDAQVTLPVGAGLVRGKAYYGVLGEKLPFGGDLLNLRGSRAAGAYLDYQADGWQWRGGVGRIVFRHEAGGGVGDLRSALVGTGGAEAEHAADALALRGTAARYASLGVVLDRGPLFVQGMLGRLRYTSEAIRDQDNGMVLAGYRVGDVKPFVGYSWNRSRRSSLGAGVVSPALQTAFSDVMGQTFARQQTVSLGVRWDVRRDAALKFQIDAIRGSRDSLLTFREVSPRWDGKTTLMSLTLDFVF